MLSKTILIKLTFFACSIILEKKFSSLCLSQVVWDLSLLIIDHFLLGAKWREFSGNMFFRFPSDFFCCSFMKISQPFLSCLAFKYSCSLGSRCSRHPSCSHSSSLLSSLTAVIASVNWWLPNRVLQLVFLHQASSRSREPVIYSWLNIFLGCLTDSSSSDVPKRMSLFSAAHRQFASLPLFPCPWINLVLCSLSSFTWNPSPGSVWASWDFRSQPPSVYFYSTARVWPFLVFRRGYCNLSRQHFTLPSSSLRTHILSCCGPKSNHLCRNSYPSKGFPSSTFLDGIT